MYMRACAERNHDSTQMQPLPNRLKSAPNSGNGGSKPV